jgi:hypothetical protein
MPGRRDRNLRSGDMHEELGLFLLRAVALVAPVPRPEDVGSDAFATLLRPDGGRKLLPDLSFLVQLKSSSVNSVTYAAGDEVAWIRALEVPLLIGRVELRKSRLELFSTLGLQGLLLEQGHDAIQLLLGEPVAPVIAHGVRAVSLGPPILAWSTADIGEPDFLARSFAVLHPHVEALRHNRYLRGIQSHRTLTWETGKPPSDNGEMIMFSPQNEIADVLREMTPHIRRVLTELICRKRYGDFLPILQFMDLMRRWGADPDPDRALRMSAGVMAGGPDISVEDAIRIRYASRSDGSLDLSRMPISDGVLAAVPNTVTALALVDTPVTDAGVRQLLRLSGLRRLNLTGTGVTDEGLAILVGLPDLEWLCVKRTATTADGTTKLRAQMPNLNLVAGTEP